MQINRMEVKTSLKVVEKKIRALGGRENLIKN